MDGPQSPCGSPCCGSGATLRAEVVGRHELLNSLILMDTIFVENTIPMSARRVRNVARTRELVIEPGRTEKNYWSDLWRYRELFYILAWRDICVRYKQTAIGV